MSFLLIMCQKLASKEQKSALQIPLELFHFISFAYGSSFSHDTGTQSAHGVPSALGMCRAQRAICWLACVWPHLEELSSRVFIRKSGLKQ